MKNIFKANPEKIVRLICDCYSRVMTFAVVKPCEWTLKDPFDELKDATCEKIDDQNNWDCDPRSEDCGGIYNWSIEEPTTTVDTLSTLTTTMSTESAEWTKLSDLMSTEAPLEIPKTEAQVLENSLTIPLVSPSDEQIVVEGLEAQNDVDIKANTTKEGEHDKNSLISQNDTIKNAQVIQSEVVWPDSDEKSDVGQNGANLPIQFFSNPAEGAQPSLGQFLLAFGKPGESGSVINSFNIAPVMTNNVGEGVKSEGHKAEKDDLGSIFTHQSKRQIRKLQKELQSMRETKEKLQSEIEIILEQTKEKFHSKRKDSNL